MKLLIVNATDLLGGAARAASRLQSGLSAAGLDTTMLVQRKLSKRTCVDGPRNDYEKAIARLNPYLQQMYLDFRGGSRSSVFSIPKRSMYSFVRKVNHYGADIVNLHWVSDGMMMPEKINDVSAPVIWTLHDMWPFTGGCHYDQECGRYEQGCGNCPLLNKSGPNDLSRKLFLRKKRNFGRSDLHVVSPSKWLADCAIRSGLFRSENIHIIPIGADLQTYKPIDQTAARNAWNLPLDKKIVLFGAESATSDRRKGFDLIADALSQISKFDQSSMELVVFGAEEKPQNPIPNFTIHYIEPLRDDVSLAMLYSAADLMIVPSRQEAFGLTASESISCGTPVLAFGIGGLKDIVHHLEDGYLAEAFDTADLARGIEWCLEDPARLEMLGENARRNAAMNLSIELTVKRYRTLFETVLKAAVISRPSA